VYEWLLLKLTGRFLFQIEFSPNTRKVLYQLMRASILLPELSLLSICLAINILRGKFQAAACKLALPAKTVQV
jgi:hypothetical protein